MIQMWLLAVTDYDTDVATGSHYDTDVATGSHYDTDIVCVCSSVGCFHVLFWSMNSQR